MLNSYNKEPVLSISIPTYGYPESVKKNVIDLLQIKRNDIEIVVVDNDETGQQIGNYMECIKDPRFHYYRNEKNIGRSNNIAMAVKLAKADYVLLVSSDDHIRHEAIEWIIELINKYPKFGVIMGKAMTDKGKSACYNGPFKIYKRGYEALSSIPVLGVLMPFVVNKTYLDFDFLFSKRVMYMQIRITKSAVGKGDFIGVDEVIADIVDQESYHDTVDLECYNSIDWDSSNEKTKWDLMGCYYAPAERAEQALDDIETYESLPLRLSHLINLIDTRVFQGIDLSRRYIVLCHDPDSVTNGGFAGFMGYHDALRIFEDRIKPHFEEMENNNRYYYVGRLNDRIKNEILVIQQAEMILDEILSEKKVYVYGNTEMADILKKVLSFIKIETLETANECVALIPENFDCEVEKNLLSIGAKTVKFMDMMGQYLITVWCDRNRNSECVGRIGFLS